jgi:hypothetical protein
MLRSLWLRFTSSGPASADERALARYYRDEGLHAELASHLARDIDNHSSQDRIAYAVRSYFAS